MFQLLLIDRGASINCVDGDGNTPLHLATNAGHDKVFFVCLMFNKKSEWYCLNNI